jgi:hypothetical protein
VSYNVVRDPTAPDSKLVVIATTRAIRQHEDGDILQEVLGVLVIRGPTAHELSKRTQ